MLLYYSNDFHAVVELNSLTSGKVSSTVKTNPSSVAYLAFDMTDQHNETH